MDLFFYVFLDSVFEDEKVVGLSYMDLEHGSSFYWFHYVATFVL